MNRTPIRDGALQGMHVAFTGRLSSMKREEALTFLEMVGAAHDRAPGPETDFLVVGEASRLLDDEGQPTSSLARARSLRDQGSGIAILSETDFLALLGLDELLRLYTTQQLGRILKVPGREIATWVRRGLIRPVKVVNRLYYFDFAQVASAKFLLDLIHSGVPIARIRDNLREMEGWYPGVGKSLVQLGVMERDGRILIRLADGSLADPNGQLQMEFSALGRSHESATQRVRAAVDPADLVLDDAAADMPLDDPASPVGPRRELADRTERLPGEDGATRGRGRSAVGQVIPFPTTRRGANEEPRSIRQEGAAETWFEMALRHEEDGRLAEAADAYHKALAVDGPSAELSFNLGNVLYGLERKEEAVQRFLQSVELEPAFIEAWNNLANALFEIGRSEEAVRSLRKALAVDPRYADAHYNLAEILHHLGRPSEAAAHWRAYLEQDPASEWAEHVRARLASIAELESR
ncbi:MAG: tetratricopeptide repeat protein [Candidatus Eisenbacteria bacterium]|uniref:Tetratricopeptide repeat protein n=1 Tax=Eiseniibacteriota bacterium TaxID=2212470 RepID=A0A956RNA3_UNCEI|nr:tetratricopeptide repeat protein [Candidatus Eisenbacteria bacterium]